MNVVQSSSIVIKESVLKTAKMVATGSDVQRKRMAKFAVDEFYKQIQNGANEVGDISVEKINGIFRKILPGVEVSLEKGQNLNVFGAINKLCNDKFQVKNYQALFYLKADNTFNVHGNYIEIVQHELGHLCEFVYCPKYLSATFDFMRTALKKLYPQNEMNSSKLREIIFKKEQYESIYKDVLYECEMNDNEYSVFKKEFKEGGKTKNEAIKNRMKDVKEKYLSEMNSIAPLINGEKIIMIKQHLRRLESERTATGVGTYYKYKYKDIPNSNIQKNNEIKDNRMYYLFTEKIKMLKALFFEEVKEARKSHWKGLGLEYKESNF